MSQNIALVLAFLLSSSSVMASSVNIIFSNSVPADQKEMFTNDLEELESFSFREKASRKTLKILGIKSLSNEELLSWLDKRVSYITGENESNNLYLLKDAVKYPNASKMPFIGGTGALSQETSVKEKEKDKDKEKKVYIVMSNYGAAVYLTGKSSKALFGLSFLSDELPGQNFLRVESPRVGILKIGEGLSHILPVTEKGLDISRAKMIYRNAILFHEARHSDGNASSLGFVHTACPKGHELEGALACDRNLNGPYSVGAQILLEMAKNCSECTPIENELLRISYLDAKSRVIEETEREVLGVTGLFKLKKVKKKIKSRNWNAKPEFLK